MARAKAMTTSAIQEDRHREPDRAGRILGLSRSGFHEVAYVEWGPVDADHVVICVHGLTRQGAISITWQASSLLRDDASSVPTWSAEGRADGCGIRPTILSCNTAPT